MKRLIFSLLAIGSIAVIFSACSSTKTATGTSVSRGKIVGTWTVSSVTFDGLLENAVQSAFDQAKPKDFEGSTWTLTNSGNGTYALANGTTQKIYWSFDNSTGSPVFQFKKIFEGDKAADVASGYKLVVANADGSSMTLKSPVDNNGSTGYVIYSFTKK
ncbi:hypothetical protein GS399_04290 [Pedobacter sp. HMF7647]|uniref:Lipocalin-like domain-containing protein n=1 Tax=Hufsiella arboris TaxID=2695275 RepID=A0A7K1Y7T8_9SPHI|nr:hypothetical protein [Hufsiella arboris]MXV50179.1 hypothetical protein [Hufsiella arboris]